MIYSKMRPYDYWKISVNEEYGQEVLPAETAAADGQVKLSIYPTSAGTQDNILYADCSYVGFTFDAEVSDKYVIAYEKERLKVMYIQQAGRMRQVFLKRVN